jgi:hypothetical protein
MQESKHTKSENIVVKGQDGSLANQQVASVRHSSASHAIFSASHASDYILSTVVSCFGSHTVISCFGSYGS